MHMYICIYIYVCAGNILANVSTLSKFYENRTIPSVDLGRKQVFNQIATVSQSNLCAS